MLTICSPTINIYVFLGYHLQINSFSGEQMHHSSIIKNVTIRHRIIFEFMPSFRLIVPTLKHPVRVSVSTDDLSTQ